MIDETAHRREPFADGPRVNLADGGSWSLPLRETVGDDPEYDALLAMVAGAEDRAETLRFELALTIFLLTRNYVLSPETLDTLLRFAPGDPALAAAQRVVHDVARESTRRAASAEANVPSTPHTQPSSARSIRSPRKA